MIDIKFNFDSRKLEREMEREAHKLVEKEVRKKLSDLIAKGLRVRKGTITRDKFNFNFEGPDELVLEAKRRLS